jgi:TolA-binding protein
VDAVPASQPANAARASQPANAEPASAEAPADAEPDADAQAAFDRGARLAAEGDVGGALDAYRQVYEQTPASRLAPYALFEAAQLAENDGVDPQAARTLYERLVSTWPEHRLRPAADARLAFLARNLASGDARLATYEELLAHPDHTASGLADGIARMEALLEDCRGGCTFEDQARYWLGNRFDEAGAPFAALASYQAVIDGEPSSPVVPAAVRAQAELLLREGQLDAAASRYRALVAYGGDWPAASAEGLGLVRGARVRRAVVWAAGVYVILFVALHLFWMERRRAWPRPVPFELKVYLVPAVLLTLLAAFAGQPGVLAATLAIAAGGALIIFASGALDAQRTQTERWARRLLRAATVAAAVVSLAVVSIDAAGLGTMMLNTLEHGAER